MVKPCGRGRKKTRTEMIQNKSHLQVTFSKRRKGLFTKDYELSILCGGQSATVIFAPNTHDNKTSVYSLGHPDVNSVIDKFLGLNIAPETNNNEDVVANTHLERLNEVKELLDEEEARAKMLDEKIKARGSFEELNSAQLGELIEKFEFIMEKVEWIARQQEECNIQFPYSTLGDALAP